MRVPSLRLFAALAVTGALAAGTLAGCGKGSGSRSSRSSGEEGAAVSAQGVVGISTKNTTRLGGAEPADDAAAVARAVFPGFTPATRPQAVVLVNQRDWPAALAASSLAGAPLGAPLLFADGDSLPDATSQALHAMRPIGASALGGAQVIRIATGAALPDGLRARSPAPGAQPAAAAVAVQRLGDSVRGTTAREVLVVGVRRAARAADAGRGAGGRVGCADPVRRTRAGTRGDERGAEGASPADDLCGSHRRH